MRQISQYIMILLTATSVTAAELPEKCRSVPAKGPCKAMIEKFYFNQTTQKCTPYFYDGCGPVVPFNTLDECKKDCEVLPPANEKGTTWLTRDPLEKDPRYAEIFKKIDSEVDQALAKHPLKGRMGFCYTIWETKKRILKENYHIDWQTPAELNPQVMFD
jgi:hypothetical protein